jgi:hypothetical protein
MKKLIIIFFSVICQTVYANDGAYYASGNHLIPISENDISITKEILTIKRIIIDYVEYAYVTVNYTFYNPNSEKKILVGFEAPSPSGDVNGFPENGGHPYMSNFKAIINGEELKFKTSIVNTENYYIDDQIDAKTEKEVIDDDFDPNNPEFYYVYHFNATFRPGINKVIHTYRFNMSSSVEENYSFDYILTAANRWANNQIDDFTLIIDLGAYCDYNIDRNFFSGFDGWSQANKLADGTGFSYEEIETNPMRVFTNDKPIIFKKSNFKPKGELNIYSKRNYSTYDINVFNYKSQSLNYDLNDFGFITSTSDEESFKILRNYPYAKRGYIFKNEMIQNYYETLEWYVPNINYTANFDELTEKEKVWLKELKSKN